MAYLPHYAEPALKFVTTLLIRLEYYVWNYFKRSSHYNDGSYTASSSTSYYKHDIIFYINIIILGK